MIAPMVCVAGTITSSVTWVTRIPAWMGAMTSSATWVPLSAMNWFRFYDWLANRSTYRTYERELEAWERRRDNDLRNAQTPDEKRCVWERYYAEFQAFEGRQNFWLSLCLIQEARRRRIITDDVVWLDDPRLLPRGLDEKSLSRLYHEIREDKRKNLAQFIQVVTALTGIIGVLIGLIAILKK
jgi:hypothetical protein